MISKIMGVWLLGDGIVSYLLYREQSFKEHIFRVVRASMGIGLIILPV